jgi:hypothetical protein
MPFVPVGGIGGRPKGSLSEKTLAVREFCRSVCEDKEYRAAILRRARTNTLGPMEQVIWAYAWGRPKERVEIELSAPSPDLSQLSMQELIMQASELMLQLRQAEEQEMALPAEYRLENAPPNAPPTAVPLLNEIVQRHVDVAAQVASMSDDEIAQRAARLLEREQRKVAKSRAAAAAGLEDAAPVQETLDAPHA